ncbi:GAF sensor hybrid histidine kinase [candidate division SR1 bacterium RAAC1_SR1_1]|nr:GAF sensor hybrid histidine kinase [candidate division SR1 bacterium RAAC1_SR1_1]
MRHNAEGSTFLEKKINKIQNISLSSQTKIYLALCSIPGADIVFQGIESSGFRPLETMGLAGISAAVGYYINKHLQKNNNDLKKCLKESREQATQFELNIENLELLLKNIPGIGFYIMSYDNTYTRVNESFARMIGKRSEEILDKTDEELFPLLSDDIRNRLLASNKNSLDTVEENDDQETLEEIISLPLEDGEHIIILKKTPIVEHGQKRIMGVAIDITSLIEQQTILEEQKQLAEELARKAEETSTLKDDFLANMSHELRTPLNGIIGFSDILLRQESNEKNKLFLSKINQAGYDLLKLINNILDMAKLEAGMSSLIEKPISIKSIITDVVELQDHSINKSSSNISIIIDKDIYNLNDIVLGDEIKIQQVLNNLIGNAIKFTKEGCILIACPKIEEIDGIQKIYITVEDTGIGIPLDKQDIIFERFRQVDNSSTREYGGTGIGLSLSKKISQHMGGDITVKSELGKGSIFTFSFIVKKQEETHQENIGNMIEIDLYDHGK